MKLLLIGDVHGKLERYEPIIQGSDADYSIQLGDFGFAKEHEWFLEKIDTVTNKVLFGNHDDPSFLYDSHSLGDYQTLFGGAVFAIRGADSIDRDMRTPGYDWWPEEEIEYGKRGRIISEFVKHRPRVVLSHDCPQIVRREVHGITAISATSFLLDSCFSVWQPELWVYGHHHVSNETEINGTTFRCLAELETMEVEI